MKIYKLSELSIERPTELSIERDYINDFQNDIVARNISRDLNLNIKKINPLKALNNLINFSDTFKQDLNQHLTDLKRRKLPSTYGEHSNISSYIYHFDFVAKNIFDLSKRRDIDQNKKENILSSLFTIKYSHPDDFLNILYLKDQDGNYYSKRR